MVNLSPLRFDVRRNGEHAGHLVRMAGQWLLYLEGITTGEACKNFESCGQVLRYLNRLI